MNQNMTARIGVLLLNTGTPEKADKYHVAKYLHEFLMDSRIIDLPWIIRWPLVHGVIIPSRLKTSTEAYQKIWEQERTPINDGVSPLLSNSLKLKTALSEKLNAATCAIIPAQVGIQATPILDTYETIVDAPNINHYTVELGMRYGKPSIATAIENLQKAQCQRIIILPLFPQYASASTGSVVEACLKALQKSWNIPDIAIQTAFYDDPGFIQAYSHVIQDTLNGKSNIVPLFEKNDFLLFSYHGLPERHITKSQCQHQSTHCSTKDNIHAPCPVISVANAFCYRAQCYTTSQLLAEKLSLSTEQYDTVFQSRLGKLPWIKPYTDVYLSGLISKGIKNMWVACPSFTADCLETLEEIGIRLKAQWLKAGGHHFTLIPCLNETDSWVNIMAKWVIQY